MFGTGKARHFELDVQIDIDEYWHMRGRRGMFRVT